MGCDVFANNNEIACKAGDGKVIAAFPDVCLSPPSPPAGPVPIPYPDTSFSKDMMSGSKTVKIKNQEVMLKDQSFYKTSPLGDEAATNGLGAGVVTHVITGKTYFTMWSMDVEVEGQNVDRHIDITTSNHMSPPPNEGVPMGNLATMAPTPPDLEQQLKEIAKKCNEEVEDQVKKGRLTSTEATPSCAVKGTWKHSCCKKEVDKIGPPVNAEMAVDNCRLDVAVLGPGGEVSEIHDFKFNCSGPPRMSKAQKKKYTEKFGVKPEVVDP